MEADSDSLGHRAEGLGHPRAVAGGPARCGHARGILRQGFAERTVVACVRFPLLL